MRIHKLLFISALSLVTATAATLSPEGIAALAGSAASGTDVGFLNLFTGGFTGPLPTWSLSETATNAGWSNWSGSLAGQLLGTPMALAYAGTFLGNTLSWNTTGTYGAITVTGGGSATISYPTSSSFLVSFSDTLVSGSGAYSVAGGLGGSINPDGTFGLGPSATMESEVGPLPVMFNGTPTPGADGYSFWQEPNQANPNFYRDDHKYAWWLPTIYTSGFFPSSTSFNDSTTPEPQTYLLLGAGLLAMAIAMRKRIQPVAAAAATARIRPNGLT
jgi:hypothetical protein